MIAEIFKYYIWNPRVLLDNISIWGKIKGPVCSLHTNLPVAYRAHFNGETYEAVSPERRGEDKTRLVSNRVLLFLIKFLCGNMFDTIKICVQERPY